MYWGWDQALIFLIAWTAGGSLFALAFRLLRDAPPFKRILLCSLILAVAFTPSVAIAHAIAIVPAVHILVVSPFVYGPSYAVLLGALPIAVAWGAIAGVWMAVRRK
jgi:hypothetical protein